MVEIDARHPVRFRRKSNFDLARAGGVEVHDLEVWRDVPRDDDSPRRLPRGDRSPLALVAIRFAAHAPAADARLDDRLLHRLLADVMAAGPPRIEAGGEHVE